MLFYVTNVLKCCSIWQYYKHAFKSTSFELVKPHFFWNSILIEIIRPLTVLTGNFKYIILAIDELTKWIEVKSIKDLGALTTAKFISDQVI